MPYAPLATGAFYLGAIVDETHGVAVLIDSNNHATGALTGFGNGPDLVITAVSGPPSANGLFQLVATVCNQGTQVSPATDLQIYASADTTITSIYESWSTPDFMLSSRWFSPLQPGECDATPVEACLPAVIGAFHLGAIVDETRSTPELIESNNRTTGALITFGEQASVLLY